MTCSLEALVIHVSKTNEAGESRQRAEKNFISSRDASRPEKCGCVFAFPISVANLPATQFILSPGTMGHVGQLNWGLVMRPAYPPDSKREFRDERHDLYGLPRHGEDNVDEEPSDGVVSLLEENARLRGLVVKLTDLILKNVADRG
jgi:hypothetical protein